MLNLAYASHQDASAVSVKDSVWGMPELHQDLEHAVKQVQGTFGPLPCSMGLSDVSLHLVEVAKDISIIDEVMTVPHSRLC